MTIFNFDHASLNNVIIGGVKAAAANLPLDGEKGTYTQEMFLADFPQFTQIAVTENEQGEEQKEQRLKSLVPEGILHAFILNVNSSILPSCWKEMWRYAAGLYVAHFATQYLQTYSEGSAGTAQAAAKGQTTGNVKSATMGDTSISYDNTAVTAGTEKWGTWNATQYGQQLVTMARLIGMGGMYVI